MKTTTQPQFREHQELLKDDLVPLIIYLFSKGSYRIYAVFNPNNRWFIEAAVQEGERTYSSGNVGRANYQSSVEDLHQNDIITLENTDPAIKNRFQEIAYQVYREKKVSSLTEYRAISLLEKLFPQKIENNPPVVLFKTISAFPCALGKESKRGLYHTGTEEVLFVQSFPNDDIHPNSHSRISRKSNPQIHLFTSGMVSEFNGVKFRSLSRCLEEIGGIDRLDNLIPKKVERCYGEDSLYDTVLFKWWDVPDTQGFFKTLKEEYQKNNKTDLDWMLRSLEI